MYQTKERLRTEYILIHCKYIQSAVYHTGCVAMATVKNKMLYSPKNKLTKAETMNRFIDQSINYSANNQ